MSARAAADGWIYFGFPGDARPIAAIPSRAMVLAQRERARLARKRHKERRRLMLAGSVGSATPTQVQARIDYYGGRCWMCGGVADSIDHVIPIARGGAGWASNLRPACRSCNSRKGAR